MYTKKCIVMKANEIYGFIETPLVENERVSQRNSYQSVYSTQRPSNPNSLEKIELISENSSNSTKKYLDKISDEEGEFHFENHLDENDEINTEQMFVNRIQTTNPDSKTSFHKLPFRQVTDAIEAQTSKITRDNHQWELYKNNELCSQINQFFFVPFSGDHGFAIGFFEKTFTGGQLKKTYWEGVSLMNKLYQDNPETFPNIEVWACSCDGAGENRAFIKHHTRGSGLLYNTYNDDKYPDEIHKTYNSFTKHDHFFIGDFYHQIKKLRNNIYRSFNSKSVKFERKMKHNNENISWEDVVEVHDRDRSSRYVPISKLTPQHLELNSRSAMNTKFATDVFSSKVINDIKEYDKNNKKTGTIWFLGICTKYKKIINTSIPIVDKEDPKLSQLEDIYHEFVQWDRDVQERENKLTSETMNDMKLNTIGFVELSKSLIELGETITPRNVGTNIVENFFSVQRQFQRGNSNVTVANYRENFSAIVNFFD
jgi:hypothetical protein